MDKFTKDLEWYKKNAEYYRSADATSNSYTPKIKSQANKIDSLKKELEEKTKEFENISAQNQVIIDEINKEKEITGTFEKFLEDFELINYGESQSDDLSQGLEIYRVKYPTTSISFFMGRKKNW